MITHKHRFQGYNSLRYTYRNGKTIRGPFCALKFSRNNRRTSYRVAVVVSKKVSKSAVLRNRIRRRVYEVVRKHVIAEQPYDLIFTVFSDRLATMTAAELDDAILSKLEEATIALKPASTSARHGIVNRKEI
jgi:ribonuclease P protein component